MSLIELYAIGNLLLIGLALLLLFFRSSRGVAVSGLFSLLLFYLGAALIGSLYPPAGDYRQEKLDAFARLDTETVNLSPSLWLQAADARGRDNIIPLAEREKIGGFFPLSAAPGLHTLYCREDGDFIHYQTDRFGFRNVDAMWEADHHHAVLIGDSFAESACVAKPLTDYFPSEKRVLSLGKGGNGPLISLATLAEYLEAFHAETIYHLIVPNDYSRMAQDSLLIDVEREIEEPALQQYLHGDHRQGWFSGLDLSALTDFSISYTHQQKARLEEDTLLLHKVARVFSFPLINQLLIKKPAPAFPKQQVTQARFADAALLSEVYSKMHQLATAKGSNMEFVILPAKASCDDPVGQHAFIRSVLNTAKLPTLDLWQALCDASFFASNGVHFNADGYKKLVEQLQ